METSTAIGIDIGGTNLRAARISSGGAILERICEPVMRDPEALAGRISALAARLDRPDVVSVGIGIPGRVDAAARRVLSGGYVNLAGLSLAEVTERALGKPVFIDNDCNMALVAEIAVGAARGRDDVVMFTIGTGIGGAVVQDGKILRGRRAAGQLGHITVDIHGAPCACGRRGCIETTSSGTALGQAITAAGLPAGSGIEAIFAKAKGGDAAAIGVLAGWAEPLRAAIDSVVAAFDPQLVLLGGGLGIAAERAIAAVPARAPWYQCPVAAASLGDDAGVIGAGLAALVELFAGESDRATGFAASRRPAVSLR